jgi:predicted nucleic acid-binding protein
MNWFLYIITKDFIDEDGREIKSGEAGVGECSMSPGIKDAFNGVMYVVPGQYIREQIRLKNIKIHPSAGIIREIIEEYYNKKEVVEISKDDNDFFID